MVWNLIYYLWNIETRRRNARFFPFPKKTNVNSYYRDHLVLLVDLIWPDKGPFSDFTARLRMRLNGKQRSAGGFIWKKGWGKDKIDLSNYLTGAQYRGLRRKKKIRQYSAGGKYIRTFPSVKEASKSVGITPSAISTCLRREGKLAKGFIWKAVDQRKS